jgi:hypothetical protein
MRIKPLLCALLLCTGAAAAQETDGDAPLTGPDWLSDTIIRPHGDVATSATPPEITVMPLGQVRLDAVGILPFATTGLPAGLWADSAPDTLARLMLSQPAEGLPAMLALTRQLALAELDPPQDASTEAILFLARLDLLLDRGALEPARALMERAGPADPRIFRRWFDVSLLTGQAERACAAMRASPDIAPTFPARIFCLARSGDWPAAALSLGTGEALGFISTAEADLIARFLDPELFEGEPPLPLPPEMTPLHYQMLISLGERPPSNALPLAFAHADLADLAGWRAQLDAAERLMRAGAIEPEQWLAIYTARTPAASGGVWERVDALQSFDAALLASDPEAITRYLPEVWAAMQQAGLETAFARLYSDRLLRLPLTGEAAMLARRVGLLSPLYEAVAQGAVAQDDHERFLFAIARGEAPEAPPRTGTDAITTAVATAFADTTPPERFTRLLNLNRTGEALLRAARTLSAGAGDTDDMADALRLFRALGLEDTARRAALQLMILDRA